MRRMKSFPCLELFTFLIQESIDTFLLFVMQKTTNFISTTWTNSNKLWHDKSFSFSFWTYTLWLIKVMGREIASIFQPPNMLLNMVETHKNASSQHGASSQPIIWCYVLHHMSADAQTSQGYLPIILQLESFCLVVAQFLTLGWHWSPQENLPLEHIAAQWALHLL